MLIVMRGRSRMAIEPRKPTIPRRSTQGYHRLDRHHQTEHAGFSPTTGRHCQHEARSAVSSASRMKGELHLTKNPW